MNNKKVLWIVVALVILAIILYFLFGRKGSDTSSVESQSQSAQSQGQASSPANGSSSTQASTSSSSLKDLISAGKPTKCTFNESGNQGTFYVAKNKARGDFSTTANGQTMKAHMIMDGQTSYFWVDGQSQGFKTTVSGSTPPVASDQSIDANTKMNFSCSAWSEDSSMFALPAGVNFLGSTYQLGN